MGLDVSLSFSCNKISEFSKKSSNSHTIPSTMTSQYHRYPVVELSLPSSPAGVLDDDDDEIVRESSRKRRRGDTFFVNSSNPQSPVWVPDDSDGDEVVCESSPTSSSVLGKRRRDDDEDGERPSKHQWTGE